MLQPRESCPTRLSLKHWFEAVQSSVFDESVGEPPITKGNTLSAFTGSEAMGVRSANGGIMVEPNCSGTEPPTLG